MFKRFYGSLVLVSLAFMLSAGMGNAGQYFPRMPGAKIVNFTGTKEVNGVTVRCNPDTDNSCTTKIYVGNCDPKANPDLDGQSKPNYQKSCIGQNINRDNFKVTINFDPKQPCTLSNPNQPFSSTGNPCTSSITEQTIVVPGVASLP